MRTAGFLLRYRTRQLKKERERGMAMRAENAILSAYLAILIEEAGEVRVPKECVGEMLGHYSAAVRSVGDDYVITLAESRKKELYGGE